MATTKKAIIDAAEELGWSCTFDKQRRKVYNDGKWDKEITEKYVEFSQFSPAGQDFSFDVWYDNLGEIMYKVYEYYQDYDVEEEVLMWLEAKRNGIAGVPDVQTLVHDQEEIEQMILELAEAIKKVTR